MQRWMVAVVALGMGAAAWAHAPQAGPADDKPKGADTFAVLRAEWARNLHDKRVAASVAEYAPDGEFMDPGGGRVRGAVALRELFQTITVTYDSDLKFTSQHADVRGELAYDSGTYTEILIVRASGRVEHSSGSYLTIYERGKGGEWLIAEQMWTGSISDAPETAGGVGARALPPADLQSAAMQVLRLS